MSGSTVRWPVARMQQCQWSSENGRPCPTMNPSERKRLMFRYLLSRMNGSQKARLKAFYAARKRLFIERFLSYGSLELESMLRLVGVKSGDTVMLHSAFGGSSGFRGSPKDLT